MEVKNSGLVKRNGSVSYHAHRFVFPLIDSAMIFLPCGYVPASVDLGGRLPFRLQRCKVSLH